MAKNTLMLYIRMFLLICVQLYTVPIILKNLGVEDYGIYNVVGGVVSLFSFIGGSLASGTQRFIAFAIGKNDEEQVKAVFNSTLTIYAGFSLLLLLLLEIGGAWFLNTQMNIPYDRMNTANWVFQLSLLAFLVNLISIPYNSAVIAHEKMSLFAYVSILECLLKLGAAMSLTIFLGDKLLVYSILICLVSVIIRIVYRWYCTTHFRECRHVSLNYDRATGKELLTYSGWNVIGTITVILRTQGTNIVMNLFFGPLLNAAHTVAQQINGALTQFINNIYMATRPQITKKYAQNEMDGMWRLVFHSNKLAFFLLLYLGIPAVIELPSFLTWWLHEVPDYTIPISRLLILSLFVETLANQLISAFQATNKIKKYQLYSSSILLLNIPVAYIFLRCVNANPLAPYLISCVFSLIYIISIAYVAMKEINMNIRIYATKVVFPSVSVGAISFIVPYYVSSLLDADFARIIITTSLSIVAITVLAWTVGLDKIEKTFVIKVVKRGIMQKYKY